MPATLDTARGKVCSGCGRLLEQTRSGEWRCPPCRAQERTKQRRRAQNQANHNQRVTNIRQRREDADLSEDEARLLVQADGPSAVDCDDDFALGIRIGAVTVTTDDLLEADQLWATGQAKTILKRGGVTHKDFAQQTGASPRMVAYWLAGTNLPKASKHRAAAAAALLAIKDGNDDDDIDLYAHGLPTTRAASLKHFAEHEPYQTDAPWEHCVQCRQARRLRSQTRPR